MGLASTFDILRTLPAAEAVSYLEAALAEPYEEIQGAAFEILSDPKGYGRTDLVVRSFGGLLPSVRRRIQERRWLFFGVARDMIRRGTEKERRAAYEMLAAVGEVEAAQLLAAGVNDQSTVVRTNAADAVEKIGLRYLHHLRNAQGDPASRTYVEQNRKPMQDALEVLLRNYTIHRKAIFLEIAIESGPTLYPLIVEEVMGRPESPVAMALRAILKEANSRPAIELLFRLSADRDESIREAAEEIMGARRDRPFLLGLVSFWETLPADRYLQLASRTKTIPWWGAVEENPDLEPRVAGRLLDFLGKTFVPPAVRDAHTLTFLRSPDAAVRIETLRTLHRHRSDRTLETARRLLEDPETEVQLQAVKVIEEIDPPEIARVLAPLLTSPHEEVRRRATRQVSDVSFERYLRSFDRLDSRTRELAARALSKIDLEMMDRLAEEIGALEAERRLKALRIIAFVDAKEKLAPLLLDLLNDPDRRVRATAIKSVELSGNLEGMKLVVAALNDPDRRIRANAVEAFEAVGDARFVDLLLPLVQDPDNRVRANAAKALWNLGRREVRSIIEGMLEGEDENMRLSAAWTIGELGYEGGAEILSRRLEVETSERVGAKIAEVLRRLGREETKE